jgi:hypothetical protein
VIPAGSSSERPASTPGPTTAASAAIPLARRMPPRREHAEAARAWQPLGDEFVEHVVDRHDADQAAVAVGDGERDYVVEREDVDPRRPRAGPRLAPGPEPDSPIRAAAGWARRRRRRLRRRRAQRPSPAPPYAAGLRRSAHVSRWRLRPRARSGDWATSMLRAVPGGYATSRRRSSARLVLRSRST